LLVAVQRQVTRLTLSDSIGPVITPRTREAGQPRGSVARVDWQSTSMLALSDEDEPP
jgi:hypothetical protein